jgi:hypothetical protein
MHLNRDQADVVAPGIWIVILMVLAFFARPAFIPGAVISTFILGIFYAARDAAGHE